MSAQGQLELFHGALRISKRALHARQSRANFAIPRIDFFVAWGGPAVLQERAELCVAGKVIVELAVLRAAVGEASLVHEIVPGSEMRNALVRPGRPASLVSGQAGNIRSRRDK